MTAHAMEGDRQRCLAAGMDAYIAKPLRARQLVTMIEAVARAPVTEQPQDHELIDSDDVYDSSAALKRLEGDEELLAEQISFFLEDSPILIRDIRAAMESNDTKRLQMAAHRIRGLSAGFDAMVLTNLAAQLEEFGQVGRLPDNADEYVNHLERLWLALTRALECHLGRFNTPRA